MTCVCCREIWNLRDEYDKLESHCRRIKNKGESEGEEDEYDEYDDNQERESEFTISNYQRQRVLG